MRLLLHICCAPCLIYPSEKLRHHGFSISGVFYNPNIHPYAEYRKRKEALSGFSGGIEVFYPEYNPAEFFQAVNLVEQRPERCPVCWYMRMKRTARLAKEKDFEYFSSTLLVSPYQDQEALNRIGNDIAREEGIKFFYEDFRTGFKASHDQAKSEGIYCQKYCGCIYSEVERCRRSERH